MWPSENWYIVIGREHYRKETTEDLLDASNFIGTRKFKVILHHQI